MAVRAPLTDSADLIAWRDVLEVGREAIHFEQETKRLRAETKWLRAENEALTRSLDDVLKDLAEAEGLVGRLKREIADMGGRV